jgi:hypothetical protein
MRALNFNEDTQEIIEYVMTQFRLADEGDAKAQDYLNYLQDYEGDLFEDAQADYLIATYG